MKTKTKKKAATFTLRELIDQCSLVVIDFGGYHERCWKGKLAENFDDWKFVTTKDELHLVEGETDRLQYSFDIDRRVSATAVKAGKYISLSPLDGEQACGTPVKLRFLTVGPCPRA